MKARRAARELALLAFSQLSRNIDKYEKEELEEIILVSVRTLVEDAQDNMKDVLTDFVSMKDYIENYEIDHTINSSKPVGTGLLPVPIPLTSDMTGKLDIAIEGLDKTLQAIDLIEISALSNKREVKEYAVNLITTYATKKEIVDAQIQKHSKGWNIDRLVRIDRDILRIAIIELLYFEDMPVSVSADEAVELAKKYSTEESSSFINGILRAVIDGNNLVKNKKR